MSYTDEAKNYAEALGGLDNIKTIDNCITRLRLEINDMTKIDSDRLIELGSKGTVYVGQNKFQLVIGSHVIIIADEMHKLKGQGGSSNQVDVPNYKPIAEKYIKALGGSDNIKNIDNCITRLRLTVNDASKADETALNALDNKGVMYKSEHDIHIVVGLSATNIADAMRAV